jgi:hypothetical protein
MKTTSKKTIEKYEAALHLLKQAIQNGDIENGKNSVTNIVLTHKLGKSTSTALKKLGIISGYRHNVLWNDKIPVTFMLAKKVALTSNELNSKGSKVRVTKMRTKQKEAVRISNKDVSYTHNYRPKVGLIRRFLRWIY